MLYSLLASCTAWPGRVLGGSSTGVGVTRTSALSIRAESSSGEAAPTTSGSVTGSPKSSWTPTKWGGVRRGWWTCGTTELGDWWDSLVGWSYFLLYVWLRCSGTVPGWCTVGRRLIPVRESRLSLSDGD